MHDYRSHMLQYSTPTYVNYFIHRLLHIWTVRCFDQTDIGGPKSLHFARHLNR